MNMIKSIIDFNEKKGFICDMDGVIWVKFYPDDVQKVLFARTFGCVIASAS